MQHISPKCESLYLLQAVEGLPSDKTGSHFLFICMCVRFYSAEESATEEMVSYGNYCYFLCDVCDVSVRDGRVMLKKDNLLSDVCWSLLGSRLNLRIVSTTRVCPKLEHTLLKDYSINLLFFQKFIHLQQHID